MLNSIVNALKDPKVAGGVGMIAGAGASGLISVGRRALRNRADTKAAEAEAKKVTEAGGK